jgi:hypothetical protein
MPQAKKTHTKPEPEEEPDTAVQARDDLDQCIRDARAIVGILGDGVEVRANLDDEEVGDILYLAYRLLKDADVAADRLHSFAREGA